MYSICEGKLQNFSPNQFEWRLGEGSPSHGGYWGNKIPRVDQNQDHCLVEKGDLQRLGEETPTENQPAHTLRWQTHH